MIKIAPREGWRINGLRRCYERGDEEDPIRIYASEDGFVASVSETWIEGFWTSFEEAERAAMAAAGGR